MKADPIEISAIPNKLPKFGMQLRQRGEGGEGGWGECSRPQLRPQPAKWPPPLKNCWRATCPGPALPQLSRQPGWRLASRAASLLSTAFVTVHSRMDLRLLSRRVQRSSVQRRRG
jgi:hypothetical protein